MLTQLCPRSPTASFRSGRKERTQRSPTRGPPTRCGPSTLPSDRGAVSATPPAGVGRTPARSPRGQGRYLGRLPRPMPCPTVYFPLCSTTAPPAIWGKDDDFHDPLRVYSVPPCVYKRRRRASFKGVAVGPFGRTQRFVLLAEHTRSSETRSWHSPQSTPSLAETWDLPSLSRLACTPYYRHIRCKII